MTLSSHGAEPTRGRGSLPRETALGQVCRAGPRLRWPDLDESRAWPSGARRRVSERGTESLRGFTN